MYRRGKIRTCWKWGGELLKNPSIEGEDTMDVYLDDLSSEPVATLEFSTKGRAAATAKPTSGVTGTHREFFAFKSANPYHQVRHMAIRCIRL